MIEIIALLIVFICLCLNGGTANLLSLGSNDFNPIIDGAVVMVEEVFAAFVARPGKGGRLFFIFFKKNILCVASTRSIHFSKK